MITFRTNIDLDFVSCIPYSPLSRRPSTRHFSWHASAPLPSSMFCKQSQSTTPIRSPELICTHTPHYAFAMYREFLARYSQRSDVCTHVYVARSAVPVGHERVYVLYSFISFFLLLLASFVEPSSQLSPSPSPHYLYLT